MQVKGTAYFFGVFIATVVTPLVVSTSINLYLPPTSPVPPEALLLLSRMLPQLDHNERSGRTAAARAEACW